MEAGKRLYGKNWLKLMKPDGGWQKDYGKNWLKLVKPDGGWQKDYGKNWLKLTLAMIIEDKN